MKRKLESLSDGITELIQNLIDKQKDEPPHKKRKIDDETEDVKLKEDLKCPVTMETFIWPVTVICGHTFESNVLKEVDKCPLCRNVILHHGCGLNYTLINIIDKCFPEYRKEKIKEYERPKNRIHFGTDAVDRVQKEKDKNEEYWFNYFKKDFEDIIKKGWIGAISTTRIDALRRIESRGNLHSFIEGMKRRGILFEITKRIKTGNKISEYEYEFVKNQ